MYTELLPYQQNSAKLFSHFSHLPNAVFLDSGYSEKSLGRYDIISAEPKAIITDLTDAKAWLAETHRPAPHHLPFTIGAIGYVSYDACRIFESIPRIAKNDIALPIIHIGIYDWSIVIDHHKKKLILSVNMMLMSRK